MRANSLTALSIAAIYRGTRFCKCREPGWVPTPEDLKILSHSGPMPKDWSLIATEALFLEHEEYN